VIVDAFSVLGGQHDTRRPEQQIGGQTEPAAFWPQPRWPDAAAEQSHEGDAEGTGDRRPRSRSKDTPNG
jgi:hypothetical protein